MLDGCSAHKCQGTGGGGGGADCALLQHNSLPLYQSRGAEGIRACLGPDALTTTVLREPSARTVSAYFYYACGSARTAEQLAAELVRPEVLRCAHAHEYGDTFGSHGLGGMLVGLTEEEDGYLVLLAHPNPNPNPDPDPDPDPNPNPHPHPNPNPHPKPNSNPHPHHEQALEKDDDAYPYPYP